MKKVLALVLAVMMLATVAFAADTTNPGNDGIGNDPSRWKPGETIKITALGIIKQTNGAYNFIDSGVGEAGEDFKIIKDLNSTNYTIQSVKYDDGKAMVSGVSFNDKENRVKIKLKKDFTTTKGKKLDMIAANDLRTEGAGFGTDTNAVTLLTPDGAQELPLMSKADVSAALLDAIEARRA